jgi:hypothetical protein
LPVGLSSLTGLHLSENQLTNVILPPDLGRLANLYLGANPLTYIDLPHGLSNLTGLFFTGDQLTSVTLPADMLQLAEFGFLGNPLATFVLPDLLATGKLTDVVGALRDQGTAIYTYPLIVELGSPEQTTKGEFEFTLTGPSSRAGSASERMSL